MIFALEDGQEVGFALFFHNFSTFLIVGSNVAPYTNVVGNPARELRKRFDEELIALLLKFKWWDKSIEEIDALIPVLTSSDLVKVKAEISRMVKKKTSN